MGQETAETELQIQDSSLVCSKVVMAVFKLLVVLQVGLLKAVMDTMRIKVSLLTTRTEPAVLV